MRYRYISLIGLTLLIGITLLIDLDQDNINPSNAIDYTAIKKFKKDRPEAFAEFHQLIRTRIGEKESRYPLNYQFKEFNKAKKRLAHSVNRNLDQLPWEERGPGNVGGRTRAIVVDSRDPTFNTWYLGAVGGGIWKTTDAGVSWTDLTPDFPNLGISSLVQTRDPNIFYAGTGNAFVSRGTNGNGIWKSLDGGETWQVLPATENDSFRNVFRIDVNPSAENEIVAATIGRREFGFTDKVSRILKSTDGGTTWALKHEKTGGRIQQLLYADNTTLYAGVNGNGVMKSDDGGEFWSIIWEPPLSYGRIEIAALGDFIYAAIDGTDGDSDRIFRSDDAGATWNDVVQLDGSEIAGWLGGQGWFDNAIAINPANPLEIYAAGQSAIIRLVTPASPLGTTLFSDFTVITDGYNNYGLSIGSKGVHVDHHNLILKPHPETQALFILNGNDGGVSFSRDGGVTFQQTGDSFKESGGVTHETLKGYNTAQFYGVDKMNGGDRYVGGTQDNGSWVSARNPGIDSEWTDAPSGDGFEAAWNYADSNLILESSQFNNIYRSSDGGITWINVDLPEGGGPFITRIENSKLSPGLVFMTSSAGLYRSADFGASWRTIVMPDLWEFNGSIGPPLEISLASPRIVWSGEAMREDSRVCISIDGGNHFAVVNNFDSLAPGLVTGISSHPLNEKIAYVLFSIPGSPKVLQTRDLGQTWTDLSGFNPTTEQHENGYPDVATYSLLVMPFDTNRMWVGTEIGIFESTNGGQSWLYSDNGFPAAPVWDIKIVNDEIVVATHGRGVWSVTMPELEGYEPIATLAIPELTKENTFGDEIAGSYRLASPFDSSRFKIVDEITGVEIVNKFIPGNADVVEESFMHNVADVIIDDTIQNVLISLTSYVDTLVFLEEIKAEVFNPFDSIIIEYDNNFKQNKEDFARLGMYVSSGNPVLSDGLNTPHEYDGNSEYKSILRYPIRIENEALLSFDEIVLVEPGASADPDNAAFFDYVEVQGTADRGSTWVRLEKYDSSADSIWLLAYENNEDGHPGLILSKSYDLTQIFEIGDEVFLRFRLVSDPFLEGWGWWIDNLEITSDPTATEEIPIEANDLHVSVFPNPFTSETQVQYELHQSADVDITLFDLQGKVRANILHDAQGAGVHRATLSNERLIPGLYLLRLQVGDQIILKKIQMF